MPCCLGLSPLEELVDVLSTVLVRRFQIVEFFLEIGRVRLEFGIFSRQFSFEVTRRCHHKPGVI